MTRLLPALFIAVFSLLGEAQQVVPLFRNDSLKTYVTMPFMLQDAVSNPMQIMSIEIVSGKSSCAGILDPHIRTNFLLKCTSETNVTLNVFFKQNDEIKKIVYGPLTVLKISDSGAVQPVEDNTDPYAQGRALFVSKQCSNCHGANEKPNRTFTQIRNALNTQQDMRSLVLTDDEVRAISAYLSNL